MKTIQLHGILAKKFGRFFKLDVKSAKEAVHAIAVQIPAFRQFMNDSERLGYRFAVFNGKKRNEKTNIGENQLNDTTTANHIHIVPKRGIFIPNYILGRLVVVDLLVHI